MKRALISVYHKDGIEELARFLVQQGFEIVSTGGTQQALEKAKIPCRDIVEITGFPSMMDGRLKTLHPLIFGGLLADRDRPHHLQDMNKANIAPIDLLVVNFYPFEKVLTDPALTPQQQIELIDIGGPCMVRAAAKNHRHVLVLMSPAQYAPFMEQYRANSGRFSLEERRALATQAFAATRRYDSMISAHFAGEPFPPTVGLELTRVQSLRYGENPHQAAAAYAAERSDAPPLFHCRQLQGKELSFNNFGDLDGLLRILRSFPEEPTCAIVKHANPCGVASDPRSIDEAFARAYACDTLSAFGGVFGFTRPLTAKIAEILSGIFLEIIAAPDFEPAALALLAKKKNLRLLQVPAEVLAPRPRGIEWRPVEGGFLAQSIDPSLPLPAAEGKVVTRRRPTDSELAALEFANRVCMQVKSNAIVLVQGKQTVGIGAGQMSRIDACQIAVTKAGEKARGAVLASDAFFPFRDSVDQAARAGVSCIVQPGGSIKDEEVFAAADELGLAMVVTGQRHFRH